MSRIALFGLCLVLGAAAPVANADELACNWRSDRQAAESNGWIIASQGRDETSQEIRLKIWGTEVRQIACAQLGNALDETLVIVSRNVGTGPYYRLQILDFRENGISTWSYWSEGQPRIDDKRIFLGKLKSGYTGAGSETEYRAYAYTESGLVPE